MHAQLVGVLVCIAAIGDVAALRPADAAVTPVAPELLYQLPTKAAKPKPPCFRVKARRVIVFRAPNGTPAGVAVITTRERC
jgi:hypothetical protein